MTSMEKSIESPSGQKLPELNGPDLWIAHLLMNQVPKELLQALRAMANLQYPILDRQSLLAQIEGRQNGQDPDSAQEQLAFANVSRLLGPRDFPILSPVGGMEKLFFQYPNLFLPPIRDTIERPTVDIRKYYQSIIFVGHCVDSAVRAYMDARRHDVNEWDALRLGKEEGLRCQEEWLRP